MRRRILRRLGWLPAVSIVAIAATAPLPSSAHASNAPENGIATMCKSSGPGDANYVLTAKDGYILTPDLNSIYTWSYSSGSDGFQEPGPLLCVNEGDTVTITLHNSLPVPTSINVLGIAGMTFSGVDAADNSTFSGPATPSAADLAAGNLVPSVASGSSGTYTFVASHAGTYLYESGTSPQLQDQMGMFGAVIVRPCIDTATKVVCTPQTSAANRELHPDYVYNPVDTGWDATKKQAVLAPTALPGGAQRSNGFSTQFNTDREFVHILSEIDPDVHACFEEARNLRNLKQPATNRTPADGTGSMSSRCNPTKEPFTYDMTQYKARYWFINGRSFPDTVDANNAQHLPGQPFSSLVHVTPRNTNDLQPAVIRYLNAGPVAYPFHPHAQHESVIGVDGRARAAQTTNGVADLSEDHFGLTVAPGQTLDTFFSWVDAVGWDPQTRPIGFGYNPTQGGVGNGAAQGFADGNANLAGAYSDAPGVIVPHDQEKLNGEFWSGSPYLGYRVKPKPGEVQFNECGEYYDVAHSHALFQVTNFGSGIGGMLTMVRIDPFDCKAGA